MRKCIKNDLLKMLEKMEKSEKEISKLLSHKENDAIQKRLEGIQKDAIVIGNTIEELEGERIQVIPYLEEYCELVWQCGISKSTNEAKQKLDKLREIRIIITDFIRLQIAEQYEVVFIPYNASMWDSMESVWLSASRDENCICYVIPIPYYDRKPDGTFGEMHYEGDKLPDYVPIYDYQCYDFESRHPEVIYFHNPYDQNNTITSVHPDFYTSKLKKYTDLLVYIPYFVCLDDVAEHHCLNTGIFNANIVILESEKIRDTYIRVFVEALLDSNKQIENENQRKQYQDYYTGLVEKKYIYVGSPKYDKVIASISEKHIIPEEWTKIINGRRIILYNISVQALLEYKVKYINKIRNVIEKVQDNEDIVLWWRPHPLIPLTISKTMPEYYAEYMNIVDNYKSHNVGIYDDSPDLHRAISRSDAYYGDEGSVPALYRITGKPIMIQNVDLLI